MSGVRHRCVIKPTQPVPTFRTFRELEILSREALHYQCRFVSDHNVSVLQGAGNEWQLCSPSQQLNRSKNPDSRLMRRIPNLGFEHWNCPLSMEHLKGERSLLNDSAVVFF